MIGHDASLKEGIEQIKTALVYPEAGLPVLLTEESGTREKFFSEHDLSILFSL